MNRILVIQTAFIGDAILATAVLEKLHAHYPQAELDLLVNQGYQGLFEGHPFLRQVYTLNKKQKWTSIWTLRKALRPRAYDLIINLQRFGSSGLIAISAGAKAVWGFKKNPWSWLYTRRFEHHISAQGQQHEVERNHALIAELTDAQPGKPKLYPSEADFRSSPAQPYFCLAPTSVWATKQYPQEGWIELIQALPEQALVVLLGAAADKPFCEELREACPKHQVLNMAGELSLLRSAAWMAGAERSFVNDSAPLHLASAMDAPVTAIFCSTVPAFGFGPLSTDSRVVETSEKLDCRPCGLHGHAHCPKGHFRCGRTIATEAIWPG